MIVADLTEAGVLAAAYCVHTGRWLILFRQEPEIVARHIGLGARPMSAAEAMAAVAALVDNH